MKMLNFTAAAIFVVLVFYLLVVGEALLLPLVIAITFWYLINTLANAFAQLRFGNFRFPKSACLAASFFTFVLLVYLLVNFLSGRFRAVVEVAPIYQQNLMARLENLPFIDYSRLEEQNFMQLVTLWIDIPTYATSVAASFAGILASGGLILIYMAFLFLEQKHFHAKIDALVGNRGNVADVDEVIERIHEDIQKYLGIKIFTSALTGILSYIFLRIVDVDFAGVWGLLIFLLNFIPTVGSIVATIFPAMIALAQSDGYALFVLVLIGIGAVQVCVGNILEPRLMGSRFNLSPLVILLNLALWGYIWGVPGMFLCVPFLIIITIVLSYFPATRPIAIMLSSNGKLAVPKDRTLQTVHVTPPDASLLPQAEGEAAGEPQ